MAKNKPSIVMKILITGAVIAVSMTAFGSNIVQADAAPEPLPDGKNLAPGEESTMVQMVAEEVIIDVSATELTIDMGEDYAFMKKTGYPVVYNCRFWMVNQGEETESMAVRFPIRSQYEVGKVELLNVKVNGKPVDWWEDEINWHADFNWAHFNVTFPPGEEVEIMVTYTSLTNLASWTNPLEVVTYVLETGAGWYGPIGKGRIILRLPYAASSQNVDLSGRPAEVVFTGTDVLWEFTDLEPEPMDNFWVEVVSPNEWAVIEAAREKLAGSPNNLSAQLRLAETIFLICVYDRAETVEFMPELFPEGLRAMANAVRLNPGDVDLHIQYARFLIADLNPETYALLLTELETIEELNPDHEDLDSLYYNFPINFYKTQVAATNLSEPTSTATPTKIPLPTFTPTLTKPPKPTDTPQRSDTPEPTDIAEPIDTLQPTLNPVPNEPDSPSPVFAIAIGLGVLVVLVWIVWFIWKK